MFFGGAAPPAPNAEERIASLERRVSLLEMILVEQRNKAVWTPREDQARGEKRPILEALRCPRAHKCHILTTAPFKCDVCLITHLVRQRHWCCTICNWDACALCAHVPAPGAVPDEVVPPNPPSLFSFGSAPAPVNAAASTDKATTRLSHETTEQHQHRLDLKNDGF